VIEEILERRTKQVDDKNVVQALLAEVVDVGNASCEWISMSAKGTRKNKQLTSGICWPLAQQG